MRIKKPTELKLGETVQAKRLAARATSLDGALAIVRAMTPEAATLKNFEHAVARVNAAVASIGALPRKPPKRCGPRS